MSRDLNQCNFIGRMGKDPESRAMPNGNMVVNFTMAVGDDYKDKNTGQKVEQTEWVRCVVFGNLGEVVTKYCKKGSKVFVNGKMKTRQWEKDGETKYATEIVVNDLQMLDGKPEGSAPANNAPARSAAPSPAPAGDDYDDDIPF